MSLPCFHTSAAASSCHSHRYAGTCRLRQEADPGKEQSLQEDHPLLSDAPALTDLQYVRVYRVRDSRMSGYAAAAVGL